MRYTVPSSSPFSETIFNAFERETLEKHPEFSRETPSIDTVGVWVKLFKQELIGKQKGRPFLTSMLEDAELETRLLADTTRGAYQTWAIPKKRRGVRYLLEPSPLLKRFQRWLLRWLEQNGPIPQSMVHGFVRKRSHVTHAANHVKSKIVACIDLKDFFGSVTDVHLWKVLRNQLPNLSNDELRTLLWLVTVEASDPRDSIPYERTWVSQASSTIYQYMMSRFPATTGLVGQILKRDDRAIDNALVGKVSREWGNVSDDLFLGLAQSFRCPIGWSVSSTYLGTMLCLITGRIRTLSRRRMIVEVLRIFGLDEWVDASETPKTIESLREFLRQDIRQYSRDISPPDSQPKRSMTHNYRQGIIRLKNKEVESAPSVRILPQGAPTSPWLANIASSLLDNAAIEYAAKHGLVYSRYADDLTFSGDVLPGRFVHDVAEMVQGFGFLVNREKIVIRARHQRQVVTGIIVNDRLSPTTINRRKLRAMRHAKAAGKEVFLHPNTPLTDDEFQGHLDYWNMVENHWRGADLTRLPLIGESEEE